MYLEILSFHGKRGFLRFLGDIQPKIFVIWMKRDVFGMQSQNMVLEGWVLSVREGEKAKQRFTAFMANAAGGKEYTTDYGVLVYRNVFYMQVEEMVFSFLFFIISA